MAQVLTEQLEFGFGRESIDRQGESAATDGISSEVRENIADLVLITSMDELTDNMHVSFMNPETGKRVTGNIFDENEADFVPYKKPGSKLFYLAAPKYPRFKAVLTHNNLADFKISIVA
ncbi:MAG: hypothetical protein WC269_06640 [Candidatus Gracilibacteria bacterium]|jgi:hypothetical protein